MSARPARDQPLLESPLFPLPNTVLFPRAILPLHIFEERYRAMMADALAGSRQLAMALLRPGWEKDYYGRPAIEPVVCLGKIITYQKLPDGTYNLLLQGEKRAVFAGERENNGYRVGRLEPLLETPATELQLQPHRDAIAMMFNQPPLASSGIGMQFRQMLAGPMPTADVADLAASNFLEDVPTRQALLSEPDVLGRVGSVVAALRPVLAALRPSTASSRHDPSLN